MAIDEISDRGRLSVRSQWWRLKTVDLALAAAFDRLIPRLMIWSGLIYTLIMTICAVLQHYGLQSQRNDLSVMIAGIEAAARLDPLMGGRIAIHQNLIFFLIAPLFTLFPRPETLFFLSSAGLGFAGYGLYRIGHYLFPSPRLPALLALAFWSSPAVQFANLYDFHIVCVATGFFVGMIWAVFAGRSAVAICMLFLLILCKEDMPLVGIFSGVAVALSLNKRTGLLITGISATWFIFIDRLLIPNLPSLLAEQVTASTSEMPFVNQVMLSRYGWLGSSVSEILLNVLANPLEILQVVTDPWRWRPFLYVLATTGLLLFPGWPFLLPAVPHLAMGVLSSKLWSSTVMGTYYWTILVATFLIAFAKGLSILPLQSRLRRFAVMYFGIATAAASIFFTPLPWGLNASRDDYQILSKDVWADFHEVLATIPIPQKDGYIGTTMNLIPHIPQHYNPRSWTFGDDYLLFPMQPALPSNICFPKKNIPEHHYEASLGIFARKLEELIQKQSVLAYRSGFLLLGPAGIQEIKSDRVAANAAIRALREQAAELERARANPGMPTFLCKL